MNSISHCKVTDCERTYYAKELCKFHYQRLKVHGDVNFTTRRRDENRRKHPLYQTYQSVKNRCYNERNPNYPGWGGRGITVCDRWLGMDGFTHFIEDMGTRADGYSIDRIDNDKGYSPENCRWATAERQARNRRTPSTNKSGVRGVCFDNLNNRWKAHIFVNKKRLHLGYFKEFEEAKQARITAELRYY